MKGVAFWCTAGFAEHQPFARSDGITEGLVCVLRSVQPCMSFRIRRNGRGGFGSRCEQRKCLHLYYYYPDRRVEISRAANERYLEALAVVEEPSPARELLDGVSRPVTKDARPYRALRPVGPQEASVFKVVLNGQFLLKGFTNRDVRQRLEPNQPADAKERRRASGRTTRLLRLLRAHGLIRKVSGTRYYRVTPKGQGIMTAALKLRDADVAKLAA